jgi:hypothetical protein
MDELSGVTAGELTMTGFCLGFLTLERHHSAGGGKR